MTSCEEDFQAQETTTKSSGGFKILNYGDPSEVARGSNVNNILSFQTEEDYYATLDSLDQAYNNYSEGMNLFFEGLSDDVINSRILSENIDLEEPLTNFEAFHNFISLRNAIDERERVWLQNPNPDFNETPQIHSIPTFSERCLWNDKGEVMVEGKIYKYTEDDTKFIKIEDGDFAKLLLINTGDEAIFDNENVSMIVMNPVNNTPNPGGTSNTMQCTSDNANSISFGTSNTTQVVCSNRLRPKDWGFGKNSVSAGTVTYKLNGNFFFRYVTRIKVELQGQRYNNCGNTPTLVQGLSSEKINSAVSVELKRNYKISTKYDAASSSINSYHLAGGVVGQYSFPFFVTTIRLKY